VLTQQPNDCFDATAVTQLISQGAQPASFEDMGKVLSRQWLTLV
jgi:hypothetical protein